MLQGVHNDALLSAFEDATQVLLLQPEVTWDWSTWSEQLPQHIQVYPARADLLMSLLESAQSGDHIVLMSNKNSSELRMQLKEQLSSVDI